MNPGFRVGQFVLERALGEGGMAEVWLGRNPHIGTAVAIKFLNQQFASNRDVEERFLNEGRRQGSLDHANIVQVYGFEYVGPQGFLILQYIDGDPLNVRLQRGRLGDAEMLRVSNGVLRALGCAHAAGIVHRDVKPSNILLDRRGEPHLGDFGIVRAMGEAGRTRTTTRMGTLNYMSPEQIARPKDVDHRADIYGFGCVLYEMLTGRVPFGADSDRDSSDFMVELAHVQTPPAPPRSLNPAIRPAVEQVVLKCLAKEPAQRYSMCEELRDALARAMTSTVVEPPLAAPIEATAQAGAAEAQIGLTFDEAVDGCRKAIRVNGKEFDVNVPPGVDTGNRLRLKGADGGRDFDLLVQVADHPEYERRGADLHCSLRVPHADAAAGTEVELPKFGQRKAVRLRIPAGSSAGTVFRIPEHGAVPRDDPSRKGHLYAKLLIEGAPGPKNSAREGSSSSNNAPAPDEMRASPPLEDAPKAGRPSSTKIAVYIAVAVVVAAVPVGLWIRHNVIEDEVGQGERLYRSPQFAAALGYFQKAANSGNAKAETYLGVMYSNGEGVQQDYGRARQWLEKGAAGGESRAMNGLGVLYRDGHGVARDYDQARQWFERAAGLGEFRAFYSLGYLYENALGVEQDQAHAQQWFAKAITAGEDVARRGDSDAVFYLGLLYANGYGVGQDYGKALEWFEKAADAGNPYAMVAVGQLYDEGNGVKQNYAQARTWYERAADVGVGDAMTKLADLYDSGNGGAEDQAAAQRWYEKAAEAGSNDAMFKLGGRYDDGFDVPEDQSKAQQWLEKAAEAGSVDAMVELAARYDRGDDVPEDKSKAQQWRNAALTAVVAPSADVGGLAGFLTDPAGADIQLATVIARNAATRKEFRAQTGEHSIYRLTLPPGSYSVQICVPGFIGVIRSASVTVDKATFLSEELRVGSGGPTCR